MHLTLTADSSQYVMISIRINDWSLKIFLGVNSPQATQHLRAISARASRNPRICWQQFHYVALSDEILDPVNNQLC